MTDKQTAATEFGLPDTAVHLLDDNPDTVRAQAAALARLLGVKPALVIDAEGNSPTGKPRTTDHYALRSLIGEREADARYPLN